MYILQETCPVLSRRIDRIGGKRNIETGVETVVCEEWSNTHRRMQRVVVGKLSKWEKVNSGIL
jgi:hypothetical protein